MSAEAAFPFSAAVIDASVVAKWHFEEELREQARQLAASAPQLLAPTLLLTEVASVFLKKSRSDRAVLGAFGAAAETITDRIGLVPDGNLVEEALIVAAANGRSVYDSLYVALALQRDVPLITADERLVNALRPTLGQQVMWLGELPATSSFVDPI